MNKTERKLKTFLNKGITCNAKAQKYLEKWFKELKEEEKLEDNVKQIISDWTEEMLHERTEILRVVWEDARTLSGTSDYIGIRENGLLRAETIGYFIYEDEKRIAICGFLFPDEDHSLQDPIQNTAFRDVHMIPKGWIRHVDILNRNWEETKKFKEENKDWFSSSPPVRTSDRKSDSANAEGFNKGLEVPTSSSPKLSPTEITSPNPNIMFNKGECL